MIDAVMVVYGCSVFIVAIIFGRALWRDYATPAASGAPEATRPSPTPAPSADRSAPGVGEHTSRDAA